MSSGALTGGEYRAGIRWHGRHAGRAAPVTAAVLAATLLGAGLRFYGLGHQGFWFDEANTSLLLRFPPGKMLGLIPQTESTPPLYYCVAWVWSRVFGDQEAALRSLSALAGVLVIPVAYGTAARLISRRAGVICAALAACNPLLIWYSQEARSYELLVLLTAAAMLAFALVRADPRCRWVVLWVAASGLALATHYFAVVAIIPQAGWLLIEQRHRRPVRVSVAVVAVAGLALIPLALSQNETRHDRWISTVALAPRLDQIIPQFLIGTGAPDRPVLKLLAMGLALTALVLLLTRARAAERRPPAIAGVLALAGLSITLILAAVGVDFLITRNVIALWLPAATCVAGGLALPRARRLGAALTAGLCLIGVFAAVGVATDSNLQRPDWRAVASVLGARPEPGPARAILIQHYRTLLPLSLYLPNLHVLRRPVVVDQLDVVAMRSPREPLCWWGAACNLIPSRMQRTYAISGLRPAERRRVGQFTIQELRAIRPERLSRARVALALTTTRLANDILMVQRG